ncbi:MerR family transcriptional regulator [Flexivirga endophytica]|uniref:MerR family transcriptional regulator n=1 Tax=Flexivirga endophytica TaxID=1849103 RepID=A0A916TJ33_9MICO|nr:MerR family transcriptional regulator [Flexivirga endophytica]GGB47744.1 MerR family transcriptional regulator [Flexivirga endophytica]GHB60679.1 MerR family transcriptional regulator [Flexivirga endophytica]
MRVKELADLTGTTVRTVRYYHQIGLLPVPAERGSVRDYGMAHLARLLRIRWLVDSGVPLASARAMLEEQADDPDDLDVIRTDLAVTLAGVDERIEQLGRQRDQLIRLLRTTAEGGPVSPLPRAVHRMYERLIARAEDDDVVAMIIAERQVVEFACYSGELPPMVVQLAERLTEQQLELILPLFAEFRDLDREMGSLSEAELGRRVDEMAEHAVEFVASLGLTLDEAMALLEQASLNSSEYVGYATTELFPKALQERFQQAMEAGLRQQDSLPAERKGAQL